MKLAKIIFNNGNFSLLLRSIFILLGGGMVFTGLRYSDSIILISIGLVFFGIRRLLKSS